MNKITAIILFSLCLFSALAADDYFIGTGTSTQNKVPTYGYNNYGWSKFIYTGDEMAAAGVSGTISLTGLAFQVSTTTSNYVMDNQVVYMRYAYNAIYQSTEVTYPNTSTGGWQQIYNGSVTWNGPGWVQLTFSAPFSYTYTEGQNWGIELLWENRDGSKIGGPPSFSGTSVSYSCVYKSQDASFPTTSGTRGSYHPNIWLITPPTDVPPPAWQPLPADLAENVGIETNLSWSSHGGSPDDYLFSLWKTDPVEIIENNLVTTATTYNPASFLEYGTNYSWRVIPRNSFGPALGCPTWTFTTVADPSIAVFPWTEAFDEADFPPSSNWHTYAGVLADPITFVGSSIWDQDDWLNISGTDKAAAINIWGTLNGWLISPLFKVTNPNHYLTFDLAWLKYNQPPTGTPPDTSGVDDRFVVLIGDGFTWSTANIVREWNNTGSSYVLNNISPNGERVAISLADHQGHFRLAFYAGSTLSNADNDFMVNNLYVGPFLFKPEVAIAQDIVVGNTVLSWPAVSGATSYAVYTSADPYGPWTLLGNTDTTSYEVDTTPPAAFYQVQALNAE